MRTPKLCRHKSSGQFYVWDGKAKARIHFGTDPAIARQRYAAWLTRGETSFSSSVGFSSSLTVASAVEVYRRHAAVRYSHDRAAQHLLATALSMVVELYGNHPAPTFKAKAFRDTRQRLLTAGKRARSRRYANYLGKAIQKAWRWLGAEELLPAESVQSVCLVRAIPIGEGGIERPPVQPPAPGSVEAALPFMSKTVAAMVRVQLLLGCRPGEVRRMRWEEISRDPSQPVPLPGTGRTAAAIRCGDTVVWAYCPGRHKNGWRGKARSIMIGPKAQELMVGRERESGPVFSARRGAIFRGESYSEAIKVACRRAACQHWHPNQLRHLAASQLREQFGINAAAAVLGHSAGSSATAAYVEQAVTLAAETAAKIG